MTREELGRLVRETWIAWANEQPNPKYSWTVPYDLLDEPDKEVDRRIGEAVREAVIAREFGPHASVVGTDYLRGLERLARAAIVARGSFDPALADEYYAALDALNAYPHLRQEGQS